MERDEKVLKKNIAISVLLLLGLLITVDLAFIYYQANFNQYALPSFCSVSDFIDCDGVARTTESQFFGIPLAYWGLFLYSFIIMLLCVDKLKKIPFLKFLEVFKNKYHYIAALGLISFTISMILLCVSLFVIKKLCIMCAITYVINLCIGLFAVEGIEGNFIGAIKQSFRDFLDALKPVPYRIAFSVVMLFAVVFLGWAYISAFFSPALKWQRNYGEYVKAETNKYAVKGNVLGSDAQDAVIIKVYTDYQCPMCRVFDIMLHKAVREFENVRVEHHNLPLDTECNKYLVQEFHRGSCVAARYADAAEKQGKFWEVSSLLFDKKPQSEEAVIEVLENSGFNLDMDKLKKDSVSKDVVDTIAADIDSAAKENRMGTPTIIIGDESLMGIPADGYPGLKELIIKHGGKLKHKLF